jgi:alkylation response protein AidB-like acyl-CoA dehydrogenase
MDLLPNEEQEEIAKVAAAFLSARLPISAIRDTREDEASFDPKSWSAIGDLGWFGLGLPEAMGGVGYGLAEEVLLFRELGRGLASGPFVGSVIGARLAAQAGLPDLAVAILSGAAPVAVAEECTDGHDVFDVPNSTHVLVHSPGRIALVDIAACGELQPGHCIDPGARITRVRGAAAGAAVAHVEGFAADELIQRGAVLVAAMHCGIAEAARDMSSSYAGIRVQFGKPIGVNQAIKHMCADMAVRAEVATSQLFFAAAAIDGGRSDIALQVASAAVTAADAAVENSTHNIQVHGGMGYTFEHDAHLFLKRARVLQRQFGPTTKHLADLLAAPAAEY